MDNEEIRELLKELKETSDESTAVKSKVVKIHFDTRREAEAREREKERERREAERQRLLEEEEEKKKQEALREAAEEKTEEIVSEAKAEASRAFSPDLTADMDKLQAEEPSGEDAASGEGDLNLNWKMAKPPRRLSNFGVDDDLEEEDPEEAGEDEKEEESFGEERGSLPDRILGRLRGGMNGLLTRLARHDDEEARASRLEDEAESREEADSEAGDGLSEGIDDGSLKDIQEDDGDVRGVPASPDMEMREIVSPAPEKEEKPENGEKPEKEEKSASDEEWKKRMEEPPRFNLRHVKIPDMPVKKWIRHTKPDEHETAGTQQGEKEAAGIKPAENAQDDFDSDAGDFLSEKAETSPQAEPSVPQAEPSVPQTEPSVPQSIEVVNLNENANKQQVEVIDLDKSSTGPLPDVSGSTGRRKSSKVKAASGKAAAATAGAKAFLGGLGKKLSGAVKKGAEKKEAGKGKSQPSVSEILGANMQSGEDQAGHQPSAAAGRSKALITLILILAGIVLAGLLIFWAVRSGSIGSASSSGSGVTADEGLIVRIRQQPMEYTKEGDVTLSIRVPKTIQSVTIDGNSVEFEGDKKTEVTWRATKSSMKLMVVSTDKVRSADIKLAYVDSEAPDITVSTSGGMVTLTAKDDASGVKGIYYGTCGDFSDVPLYQKYTQPFPEEDGEVYYWYAEDNAGNMTKPVSGTFTEAQSVSFEKDTYHVYPDKTVTLKAVVTPEDAYVNNMAFSSSDEKIVKIDQGNVLVPVSEGEAEVTVTADGLQPSSAKVVVSNAKTVTISAVGDLTLGTDPQLAQDTSFVAFQIVHGNEWFFQNVKGILSQDDATLGNFEGTLTTSDDRQNKKFTFKGDPSYTDILKDGSIDVVTLANNHSEDYGEQGLSDTEDNLSAAGIDWCKEENIAYKTLNGIKCAFIGIDAVENGLDSMSQMESDISEAKSEDAQLIVVNFHWNSELVEEPNQDMITLGHKAVDSGADLVVGSHSHLVSGIEKYSGKYIVYGLGNFCFGGNLYPSDYDSIIFRQTFTIDGDGTSDDDSLEIIPVHISSESGYNNYQPTPVSGEAADQIMQKINQRSTQFGSTWDQYMVDGTQYENSQTASADDGGSAE